MNPETAKNLDKLQDMIAQTIDNLIAKEGDSERVDLLKEAHLFNQIAREAIAIGDLDRAGRALECAKARIMEVAA